MGISKLVKKSSIMDVSIKFNGKLIEFNLADELRINEEIIDSEIKKQPSHFGFLLMLQAKLKKKFSEALSKKKRVQSDIWIDLKGTTNHSTGSKYQKEDIQAIVETDEDYIKAQKLVNKVSAEVDILEAAVRSFEQRSHLLQTLSANARLG